MNEQEIQIEWGENKRRGETPGRSKINNKNSQLK
jgi:hypothetical protein